MARYHLNGEGNPGVCRASKKPCPFGSDEDHFGSKEEAHKAFEDEMAREDLFQRGHQALAVDGVLGRPLHRQILRSAAYIEEMDSPTSSQRASLNAFKNILESHRAGQEAKLDTAEAPREPKRVGNVLLEEKKDFEGHFTQVSDLSHKPVGTISPKAGSWIAATNERKNLGVFEDKSEAVAALQRHEESFYKMSHQPDEDGAVGHDVETHFPNYYAHPEYYNSEPEFNRESIAAIRRMRGNPEAEVKIYRSLPDPEKGIEVGNWVSLSRKYASQHGLQNDMTRWPVIELTVKAKDIRCPGDSINEWGYFPANG